MSKKRKKKKVVKEYRKVEIKETTKYEKIEKGLYILQFVLFILGSLGMVVGLVCLGLSWFYHLMQYTKPLIITILTSFLILFNVVTFSKFKEVRQKYGKTSKSGTNRK